jgi:chloramphenicol-sensitive protein RarD
LSLSRNAAENSTFLARKATNRDLTPKMNSGIAYALAAYLAWGLLPLYLHLLAPVSTTEILAHRIVWSLATVLVLLVALRRLDWIGAVAARPRMLLRFLATAALIATNWMLYIWSINSGHVVDASLGYFINPLVNVLLAALLLHERLRGWQKLSIALAAGGVAWLAWQAGAPPWIGLGLALSFSLYGLLRKTASLGSIEGFALEAALLTPIALGYLAWRGADGTLEFSGASPAMRWLLVAAGPVTTVPLLLFAAGARRIPFSLLGVLQYLAPTLQWLTGIFVFHEGFDRHKAAGFALIWAALLLYAAESAWAGWRRSR